MLQKNKTSLGIDAAANKTQKSAPKGTLLTKFCEARESMRKIVCASKSTFTS